MTKKKFDFTESIKKLDEINKWFQEEEIDLDEGLEKLKEGKGIIKACREELKRIDTEFIKIQDKPEEVKASSDEEIPF